MAVVLMNLFSIESPKSIRIPSCNHIVDMWTLQVTLIRLQLPLLAMKPPLAHPTSNRQKYVTWDRCQCVYKQELRLQYRDFYTTTTALLVVDANFKCRNLRANAKL